jgi:hypothetical protein
VLTFERRDAAHRGKNPPERFLNLTFAGIFHLGGSMSSHNDSFVASGSSPTRSDFICENHGSIFVLPPTVLLWIVIDIHGYTW